MYRLRRRDLAAVVTATIAITTGAALLGASTVPAGAGTDPSAGTAPTVSADALPTWQVDGVVWSMATVGTTVYAAGRFTKARPPGAKAGDPREVARTNILAFDLVTGELDTSFVHTLNGQGLRVVASPDGKRVYVGGEFTAVDGQTRNRVAAFDTATGALDPAFKPSLSNKVMAIAATADTVYLGGNFFASNGATRTRLTAVRASDGANVDAWKPVADDEVMAMALAPGGARVVIGGKFQQLNGTAKVGVGAVDAATGALAPWSSRPVPTRKDPKTATSWVTDLVVSGDTVYGSANGEGQHWYDGRFAAKAATGDLVWLDNCYGATYGMFVQDKAVYSVSHAHDCSSLGAFTETSPQTWHRALAETTEATGVDRSLPGTSGNYRQQPTPSLLHWYPTLSPGEVSGQGQAAWAITGNDAYVAMGGEFPSVNGKGQQGLVRFAVRDKAANRSGPQDLGTPVATALPGRVRVAWKPAWDMDDRELKYEVYRDGGATPIAVLDRASTFWDRADVAYFDTAAGSHTYKVKVRDAFGNAVTSAASNAAAPAAGSAGGYAAEVTADGASGLWRLGEGSGAVRDQAGGADLALGTGVVRGQTGAIKNDGDRATAFAGTSAGTAASPAGYAPANLTVEAWVKTTSKTGGKIVGFGDKNTTASGTADRHLYLTNDGRVVFGAAPGGVKTAVQSATGLNNGQWHHVAGTLDGSGMKLYVDGKQAAANTAVKAGLHYKGYWRVGGDTLTGWPSAPTSAYLNGTIDEVAVYPKALTAAQIARHRGVGTGAVAANKAPVAAFTASCDRLDCAFDAAASADADGTVASYAWDFGDGRTGTGAKPAHAYTEAGTYQVRLTVTDDRGATAQTVRTVRATSPTLAVDGFDRAVSAGFGTAPTGGAWTATGTAGALSVAGGAGRIALAAAKDGAGAYLNSVAAPDADLAFQVATDKEGTGNGVYVWAAGRRVSGAGEYRARVRLLPAGKVALQLSRFDAAGAETAIAPEQTLDGVAYTPGTPLNLRVQVAGAAPTTLKAKAWTGTEPAGWQATATDSTAGLQTEGSVGVRTYLAGNATGVPVTVTVDDVKATRVAG
ncbi:LamG-like jellyroll fold domain-containing protein [Actinomadura macrotermitis]|uniref:PKD domain-containing protein n=1 Tax=Actinomadura macrotermitis TaxID=2585200 RepID=A0A7K0BTI4_9ACTN|nr:LamG-like jellyroll fold domain-containing protein [Actinomadura macrotermitis]MQY04004.1 hypothetical protein [Actinomadura macrotermitis]